MIKHFLQRLIARTGYRLIPEWRVSSLAQTEFLIAVLDDYRVDMVIDVGANRGQFGDYMRMHCGYVGRLESFEPNPVCIVDLELRTRSDPHWLVHPVALGAADGNLPLNIMRNSVFSSFRQPNSSAVPEMLAANTRVGTRSVPVRRLDTIDFSNSTGTFPTSIFLKLDTQGYDLEVLEGASDIMNHIVAVQTEASILPIYQNIPTFVETLEVLTGMCFSLAFATPVTRDSALRAVEFDLVFISNAHAKERLRQLDENGER